MGNGIIKYLKYLFQCFITVIYDDSCDCILCREYADEHFLCESCYKEVKNYNIKEIINKGNIKIDCYCASYYSNKVKELILRLKYKSDFRCGEILAEMMHKVIICNKIEFDLITFVPASSKVLKKRGYNQSEFLASLLSKMSNRKVVSCLIKVKETKDQIGLDALNRWENLHNCFETFSKVSLDGKIVLLVDDVYTTGATAYFCAKSLINSNCGNVIVLTVAKSNV